MSKWSLAFSKLKHSKKSEENNTTINKKLNVTKKSETKAGTGNQAEEYEVLERVILPEKVRCPDCGGLTLEGLEFCDKCGGEMNSQD